MPKHVSSEVAKSGGQTLCQQQLRVLFTLPMEDGGDGGDSVVLILARSSTIYDGIGHTLNTTAALLLL